MSSYEINSKHQKAGAKKKNVSKEVDVDVIDFMPEKPPARSTYKRHVKVLDKRIEQTAKTVPVYNNFDRLKICIDLRLYDKEIEFKVIDLEYNEHPDRQPSYIKTKIAQERLLKVMKSNSMQRMLSTLDRNADNINEDSVDELLEECEVEETEEPLQTRRGKNVYENCGVNQQWLPMGLNALYIKNDYFIMDITGKWMADEGYLGYINVHNIIQCLRNVLEWKFVHFNVAKAVDVATVRLCDVTLDLKTNEQEKYVRGISALSSTFASNFRMYNYKNGGALIRSTSEDVGSSVSFYPKGSECRDKRRNNAEYNDTIGEEGLKIADETLRMEIHLWKLRDIREILEIPANDKYEVALSDVLKSKAPAMLNKLKQLKITEEILRDKIKGFTEEYLHTPQTEVEVMELLAGIGTMSMFSMQSMNIRALKDMIAIEFSLEDDEKILKKLGSIIRNALYNFSLYCRPKSIKRVLDLLDIIHQAYGRTSQDEELKEAA